MPNLTPRVGDKFVDRKGVVFVLKKIRNETFMLQSIDGKCNAIVGRLGLSVFYSPMDE